MEEDGIKVNASAFSVVDKWLGDVSKAGAAAAAAAPVPEVKPGKRGRLGLGAEEPVKPKEETVLEKKVKRKRQRKEMQEANEQPLEMHGVADDLEESRVAAVSSKQPAVLSWSEDRSGDAHLPQAATAAGGDGGATTKKRKKNKKAKQQQAEEDGEQAEAKEEPQQQQQQKQQQRRQQQQRQQQQGKQPANKGQPANDTAEAKENDASGNGNDGAFKRKKTKKRSRQKNIRKDKRKDEEKPEYLRIGASDYLGRELTEATKRRLGLLPAEESASA